jgi:hypothetical protein
VNKIHWLINRSSLRDFVMYAVTQFRRNDRYDSHGIYSVENNWLMHRSSLRDFVMYADMIAMEFIPWKIINHGFNPWKPIQKTKFTSNHQTNIVPRMGFDFVLTIQYIHHKI